MLKGIKKKKKSKFIGFLISYLSAALLNLQVLKPSLSSRSPTSSHGEAELSGGGSSAQVIKAERVLKSCWEMGP